VTNPRDFVAADTAGATTLCTGIAGLAADPDADATVLVAGAKEFATLETTGAALAPVPAGLTAEPATDATALVTGATDFTTVDMTDVAASVLEAVGLSAEPIAGVTNCATVDTTGAVLAPVAEDADLSAEPAADVAVPVTGATDFATVDTTGATASAAGAGR
jgi:hypothetical protein